MSKRLATFALVLALSLSPLAAQPAFQVADIRTTVDPLSPFVYNFATDFVELGGAVYFTAEDGIHGTELWRSDGTAAGTRLVKDICPGTCSSRRRASPCSQGPFTSRSPTARSGKAMARPPAPRCSGASPPMAGGGLDV
jgi:ELWxxDGT repeat protein